MINTIENNIKTFNDLQIFFKREPYILEVIFKDIDLKFETEFSRGMKANLFALELEDNNCLKCYFQTNQYITHNSSLIKDYIKYKDFYQSLLNGDNITLFFDKDDLLSDYFFKILLVKI